MAGGLLKKSQVFADWPGIKKSDLFEGRDLNATIDARAIYCAAMSVCFEVPFQKISETVFPDENLLNYTDKLFKI